MKRTFTTLMQAIAARATGGVLLLAAVFVSTLASAAETARSFTLSNGMTLIVQPDRRAPTVVHMLWVRVGAMDEVDGTSGVAHVLEHMMFRGTPSVPPGEFSRRVAALGGRENAFTGRDATAFYQQVPAGNLEAVMRLEADRFQNNQWKDEEFQREIEVVKEERRQRTDESPRARFYEAFSAMALQAHPYRRPVIGWMSDLDAMTPQDVRDFHRRWYVPANAAVVIAGDVEVEKVRALAESVYGKIPARPVPVRKTTSEPVQDGQRRMEYRAAAEQSVLMMAWPMPRLTDPAANDAGTRDALALMVLSAVLDGYGGARLDRALVQGLAGARVADSAGAGFGPLGRGPAQFTLSAVPAAGVPTDVVEKALLAEIERVARQGVSAAELQRVKTQWAAGEIYKLDSVYNQAQELGTYWVNGLGVDSAERLMAGLRSVSADEVRSVAQHLFPQDRVSVGVLVPDPSKRLPAVPAGPRPALSRH